MEYRGNTPSAYEHFKLIRENPAYRNYLMLEELMAEREPAWGQQETITEEPQLDIPPEHRLYYQLQQQKANLIFLDKKINELTASRKRKKSKYNTYE